MNKGFFNELNINQGITKRLNTKMNDQRTRQNYSKNRQSYLLGNIKYRLVKKSEISNPSELKHIISISSSDRDSFYTLSKLLPANSPNSYASNSSTSLSSSLSSSSSTTSSNSILKEGRVEEKSQVKRHSINDCKTKMSEQRSQLTSSSSISLSASQPFNLIGNQILFFYSKFNLIYSYLLVFQVIKCK